MNATKAATKRKPARAKSAKAAPRAVAEQKIVLVGTYRKRQLERWILPRGLYNYPVKETDTMILEDSSLVSEIWLYLGKAGKRRFAAALDREISAAELDGLGYPKGMGPHHSDRYLLFRVKPLPDDAAPPDAAGAPAPHIDIRLDDFAHSEELRAELKERFFGSPSKPPTEEETKTYFDCLPEDLLEDWLGNLFVCEEAEQLTLWDFRDECGPALKPRMANAPDRLDHSAFVQSKLAPSRVENASGRLFFEPKVELGDSLTLLPTWDAPTVIVSDGPYGLSSYPGDPATPEGLAEWYRPHLIAWHTAALPSCTLWFWNSEQGWANCHRMIEECGWEFRNCHIWDKGMAHAAGNVNTKTIRKYPVVTEVCAQYVRKNFLPSEGRQLPLRDWLRAEWERAGLPFRETNLACGVKDAATRKYFTKDHLWYFPPSDAFVKIAEYANEHGRKTKTPYFSKPDGTPFDAREWELMRAKFHCELGLTNVWSKPAVRGDERLKGKKGVLHMNQKPLSLLEVTIRSSSDPGDIVWEPFGGLCSASVAAMRLGRRAFAAEINPEFFSIATKRMQHEKELLKTNGNSRAALEIIAV